MQCTFVKNSSSRSEKGNIKIYNIHFFKFIDKKRAKEYKCTQLTM